MVHLLKMFVFQPYFVVFISGQSFLEIWKKPKNRLQVKIYRFFVCV